VIVYYSGSDNHVRAVPETILRQRARVMMTYGELKRLPGGNSRFRRLVRFRGSYAQKRRTQ
jgi:hypothetical protein